MAREQVESIEVELDDKSPAANEEVVVDVEKEEVVVKADEKPEGGDGIDDGIRELKEQLERERQGRIEAEKRAREAASQANKASSEVHDTNLQLLDTAISTVKNDTAMLKERYKAALANNDYDSAADIQEAMSSNAAKLMQLEQGKVALESRPRQTVDVPSDPVEALASQLSPRSADWIRRNPQYVTDPRLNQKMVAAHNMAMADGHAADTDEYFEYVEDVLKINKQKAPVRESDESLSAASAPTQRRSSPPAAPVSRNPTNTNGTRSNVVRLTSAEREMAQMMGMTDQEYAKNKAQLIKEGKLPH